MPGGSPNIMMDLVVERSAELDLFRRILSGELPRRLLAIHGVGGVGKSILLGACVQAAAQAEAVCLTLDSLDMTPSPADLARRVLTLLESREGTVISDPVQACLDALEAAAVERQVVLCLDTYEEMRNLDRWLRQNFLVALPANVIVIIAGRHRLGADWLASPAWSGRIEMLHLTGFSRKQVTDYLQRFGTSDPVLSEHLWLTTGGHPLTLALAVSLEASQMKSMADTAESQSILWEVTQRWLREVPDERLRLMVEATALAHCCNQELLSAVLGIEVTAADFARLTALSFVRRTQFGWCLHDLVRRPVAAEFQLRTPGKYRQLQERILAYMRQRLKELPPAAKAERHWIVSVIFSLLGDTFLPVVFDDAKADGGFYMAPASQRDLAEWQEQSDTWRSTTYVAELQASTLRDDLVSADTLTERFFLRGAAPAGLDELTKLGQDCIHLLHDRNGDIVGISVVIPINRETLPFLCTQPVTAPYFNTLTPAELKEYEVPPDSQAGWYIRALGLKDPTDAAALSALLYHLIPLFFTGTRLIASSPLAYYQGLIHELGFQRVPGADHYGFGPDIPAPTYLLDLRGLNLLQYLDRAAERSGLATPDHPFLDALPLTEREREVARLIVQAKSNEEIATELFLSLATVKKHVGRIYRKAGVSTRAQFIRDCRDGPGHD